MSVANQPNSPTQYCTVQNADGTMANANVHDNTIAAFAVNSGSGALTPVTGGPAVPGLDGPRQLLVHPSGKFLYLAAANESKIWGYALDAGSGALTSLAGSPSLDFVPTELAIDPTGTPLYALTEGHSYSAEGVIGFVHIDPVTGEVGQFGGGGPVSTGVFPNTFALDASGHFLYLTSQSKGGQGQLDYSAAPYTYPARPYRFTYSLPTLVTSVSADPSGKFLFLLNPSGDALAYTIDSATGALTPAAMTPSAFSPQQPIVITKQ